jgi:hypothetical protein
MLSHALRLHPDSRPGSVAGIEVEITRQPTGALKLTYLLLFNGGTPIWCLTPLKNRADGLWRHTCFEAFIRSADSPAYREFNFAPSGQWQAYAFTDARVGGLLEPATDPQIECRVEPGRLTLTATISAADLPPGNALHFGLTAVVENAAGDLGYWALRHAAGKPDFHHPDTFVLELNP